MPLTPTFRAIGSSGLSRENRTPQFTLSTQFAYALYIITYFPDQGAMAMAFCERLTVEA